MPPRCVWLCGGAQGDRLTGAAAAAALRIFTTGTVRIKRVLLGLSGYTLGVLVKYIGYFLPRREKFEK